LNLKISASRQNIKNLVGNFEAIHLRIMQYASFQASGFTAVERGECNRHSPSLYKISKLPLALLGRDNICLTLFLKIAHMDFGTVFY